MKNLKDKLQGFSKITIIAIGSELRGDDAAGLLVARELEKNKLFADKSKFQILYTHTAPENFTGEVKKFCPSHIIMIDAAQMGKDFCEASIIENEKINSTSFSTHSLPIKIMVDYMKDEIGAETVIIGIQPGNIKFGSGISDKFKKAAKKVADEIIKAL